MTDASQGPPDDASAKGVTAAESPPQRPAPRLGSALGQFDLSMQAMRELVHAMAPTIDELDAERKHRMDLLQSLDREDIDRVDQLLTDVRREVAAGLEKGQRSITVKVDLDKKFGDRAKVVHELLPTLLKGPESLEPAKGEILHGALLVLAVSAFEVLVARILTEHYRTHPEALDPDERRFSLAELRSFPTIDDAEAAAIADRVEQHMRAGLDEWVKFFSRNCSCDMKQLCDKWTALEEAFQRRHLIVHNASRVSAPYLVRVPGSKARVGQRLSVQQSYLLRAIDRLTLLGHMLTFEVRIKWQPKELELIARAMADRCYSALRAGDWILAEYLARRARRLKAPNELTAIMQCNEWLAVKRQGRLDEVRQEIESWDTSAMEVTYHLARHCLLDELDDAVSLVPKFLALDHANDRHLAEWPLLSELRSDPRCKPFLRKRRTKRMAKTLVSSDKPPLAIVKASTPDPVLN
jgi:hypothetical protein